MDIRNYWNLPTAEQDKIKDEIDPVCTHGGQEGLSRKKKTYRHKKTIKALKDAVANTHKEKVRVESRLEKIEDAARTIKSLLNIR